MIDSFPNTPTTPSLYLDDGLHLRRAHVPAASIRSLHE